MRPTGTRSTYFLTYFERSCLTLSILQTYEVLNKTYEFICEHFENERNPFVLISFLRNVELDHLVPECRVQTTHFNSQFPFENHFQEMRSGLEILRKKFNQIEINKRPGNLYCYT